MSTIHFIFTIKHAIVIPNNIYPFYDNHVIFTLVRGRTKKQTNRIHEHVLIMLEDTGFNRLSDLHV